MLVPRALPHLEDLPGRHGERLARPFELGFLAGIAAALPGDQAAALAQERRGQLREGGQPRDRPGGDHVVRLAPGAGGVLLRAGVDHAHVLDPGALAGGAHELALAAHGLDQVDAGGREGNGEDETGEPRARADVGDRASRLERRDLQAGERVGDVRTPGLLRVADRAERARSSARSCSTDSSLARASGSSSRAMGAQRQKAGRRPDRVTRRRLRRRSQAARRSRSGRARRPR